MSVLTNETLAQDHAAAPGDALIGPGPGDAPASAAPAASVSAHPTVWGLNPTQLHDRFWAARGVQVVRQGEPSEIVDSAELFLLTDSRTLTIFKLTRAVDLMAWIKPEVLFIRLHDGRERGYRETVVTDEQGRFVRFVRSYGGSDSRLARVMLTCDRRVALLWQKAVSVRAGWGTIRQEVPRALRSVLSVNGSVHDRTDDREVMEFIRRLMKVWERPDSTVRRATLHRKNVWCDPEAAIAADAPISGSVWVGAGRRLLGSQTVVGPAVLWDDPASRPVSDDLSWQEIEPGFNFARAVRPNRRSSLSVAAKRAFDVVFALAALALTLPLYPFIMLAIWWEDGTPFFFSHKRETVGGREFGCVKFRSMRRDAERIKAELVKKNQADGPQFFIDNDPRISRVGAILRKTNLDELPQFWNVLAGDMSVVGPRPSPYKENQYCPPWREARLSVRPGITGLWQVKRTRRAGLDFQEWIRYDIEYVENVSWRLDIKIIFSTILLVIKGITRS